MKTITYFHIPENLIYDILLRLPVKSLLRFKCICKIWLALITSTDFVHKHFLWGDQKTIVLAYCSGTVREHNGRTNAFKLFVDETLDRQEEPDHLKIPINVLAIRGPCNGVFCILSRNENMALWNPATRRMKPLPAHPREYLPAHPREYIHVPEFALGFDSLKDEFKVIIIAATNITNHGSYEFPYFAVYTSSNDSWRLVKSEVLEDRNASLCQTLSSTALVNGFYYWFKRDLETLNSSILEFDMHDEVFEQIEIPEIVRSDPLGDLSNYDGSLALIVCAIMIDLAWVDIWTMKGKGVWTKLLTYVPPIVAYVKSSFGFWMKNKIIFNGFEEELLVYDLNSHQTKMVKIENVGGFFDDIWAYYYKESLVSVKAGCGSRDYEIHSDGAQDFFTRKMWEIDDLL